MEVVPQSIQQTTFDLFYKRIKDQATCKAELVKTVVEILENPSLNTFSEFLNLPEISEVSSMSGGLLYFYLFSSFHYSSRQENSKNITTQ